MKDLLRLCFLHAVRTRFLIFLMLFTLLLHYLGLWVVHSMSVSLSVKFDGAIKTLAAPSAINIGILIQALCGTILAVVYSVFVLPYLHKGERAGLTFSLPVSRWMFAGAYGSVLFILLLAQYLTMILSVALHFGPSLLFSPEVNWMGVLLSLIFLYVSLGTLMFALGSLSLTVGPVATFFLSMGVMSSLMLVRALIFFLGPEGGSTLLIVSKLYSILPPVGDLYSDLVVAVESGKFELAKFGLWLGWLAIFLVIFRMRLRAPLASRSRDS